MANIFSQFMQPVRSVTDRMADFDAQDLRREQLSGMQQQNALQALAMRQRMDADAQTVQDRNALQALAVTAKSPEEMIKGLRSSGRAALMDRADAIEKALLERGKVESETGKNKALTAKAGVDADKARLESIAKQGEMILQAVSASKDPQSYAEARQWLASNGLDVSKVPEQFNPQYVQQAGQMAMSAVQRAEQEWKAKSYDLESQRVQESARHNKAQEGLTVRGQNMSDARARQGLDLQREAARVQVVETPEGFALIDKGTGEARPALAGGKPLAGKSSDKPLTEGQAKAVAFAARMQSADKTIADLAAAGRSVSTPGSRTGFGVGAAVNLINSPEGRQLDQAKRDFVNAVLRRESGAVISDAEFANADQQYFPQIGDDAATKAQKARNRAVALEGMKADVPKSYKADLDRISGAGGTSSTKPAGKAPSVSNW